MAKKYCTIITTPDVPRLTYGVDDVIADFNRLPLPVRDGESCLLKSVAIQDTNHIGANFDIVFVKDVSGDAELGTSGSAVDITDANLVLNKFLGVVRVYGNEDKDQGSQHAVYSDLVTQDTVTITGIDLVLTSSNEKPTSSGTNPSSTGCFYGLIAREEYDTNSAGADGLRITFGFEIN